MMKKRYKLTKKAKYVYECIGLFLLWYSICWLFLLVK